MKTDYNIFLANLVYIFHLSVILFILFSPLLNIPSLLILHVAFSLTILLHWIANSNVCALSVFEAKLRGIPYTQSFSHKFIGPIYDISNTTWCYISYILTIAILAYSIYKLTNHHKWLEAKKYIQELEFGSDVSCYQRWVQYLKCFLVYMI